jgi:hypothetical protein
MDQQGSQLYGHDGSVIANLDATRKYLSRPDGSVYGYISGVGKKYLYAPSGDVLGYFEPGFLELV